MAEGLAPVKIGMTKAQAAKALGHSLEINSEASEDEASCSQAENPTNGKIGYMFHGFRVVRIDVEDKNVTTPEGATVGSSEARLKKLYGKRATFSPHPYLGDEGHYVTVTYSHTKMIFETDKGRVTSFRVGLPGPVDYIEGCA